MDENCDLCFHPYRDHGGLEGCTGTLGSMLPCRCTHQPSGMSAEAKVLAQSLRRLYRALPMSQTPRDAAMLTIEQAVLERLANDVPLLERAAR